MDAAKLRRREQTLADEQTALVSTTWLDRHLKNPNLVVVDASVLRTVDIGGKRGWKSSRADFESVGHVGGARFGDLISDFSDIAAPFDFTRPNSAKFAAAAAAIGLSNRSKIVVYDNSNGIWAARFWWLFRAFGHDRVAVLDGGLTAWTAEGRPLEYGPVSEKRSVFIARERPGYFADTADVVAVLDGHAPGLLVCALRPPVFSGAEQNYARAGHIPGSLNFPYRESLAPDGRFLELTALRRRLAPLISTNKRIIVYCGGGITAAGTALALTLVGVRNVTIYDGSLAEWSSDPRLPMVRTD